MRTCSVMPSSSECRMCADTSDYYDQIPNCSKCGYKTKRYALVEIVSGVFSDYAFVQTNGKIHKVSLDRVFDIKEEDKNVRVSES